MYMYVTTDCLTYTVIDKFQSELYRFQTIIDEEFSINANMVFAFSYILEWGNRLDACC